MVLPGQLPPTDLPVGSVIGFHKQFQVIAALGEGGMGKVFKAFDPFMNRYVALKVMKTDVPESEQRRFRLEARLCGGFSHTNLVRALDVGTTKEHGLFWFAMEFLDGKELRTGMERGPLPLPVLGVIMNQVLAALHYVHNRRIVHRDIKPANIFLTQDPYDPDLRTVKLLDFGVARDLTDPRPEDPRLVMGDPRYMAPEQTVPNGLLDGRADLYALGLTFYEAVCGQHPFADMFHAEPLELLRCQRDRAPMPPSRRLPQMPAEVADAIDGFFAGCCAKDPHHRFADPKAASWALAHVLHVHGQHAARPG